MAKSILIISVLFLYCCCNKESNKNIVMDSNYFSFEQFLYLKDKALEEGNSNAYDNLLVYYDANKTRYHELLSISIIMNDKYNNLQSNIVIYETIIKIYNDGNYNDSLLLNLNKTHREFALFYLKKGASKKIPSCVKTLEKIYRQGIGVPKNEKKADSLALIDIKIYPTEN